MAAVALGPIVGSGHAFVRVPLVCVGGNVVGMVVAVHAVVGMADGDCYFTRLSRFCAEHGCGNRTPDGEQHAKQQQNEDAKESHC